MVESEFIHWLRTHKGHFIDWTVVEIAEMALHCGFELNDICANVVDWHLTIRRLMALWENPLFVQWVELWGYQHDGEMWDDEKFT